MALSTRGANRFSSNIWPGFVDALASLVLVLTFVLTIFMVIQYALREQITDQQGELSVLGQTVTDQRGALQRLTEQVAGLTTALNLSEAESRDLDTRLQGSEASLTEAQGRIAGLQGDLASEQARVVSAEQAIAAARGEIDAQAEEARLAAARREALEALVADLRQRNEAAGTQLSDAEAARLADAAAADALRERLQNSEAELTAMALSLEQQRREAEETLTLLAAARTARGDLEQQLDRQATEAERQAALLALAQGELAGQRQASTEGQRRVALLNEQIARLNTQLGSLQGVLDAAGSEQADAELRVADLGQRLNAALLREAEEKQRRLALEEEARVRAEAEVQDLARYRSEFFGRLSQILAGREGVQVVGDRFVFSSEVLFPTGSATLSPEGREQVARVTESLKTISAEIPPEIDWVIRVDGHTDNQPLSGQGRYRDNWELSQARALAVVRYMVDDLGFPQGRLAPTGFADTRPVAPNDTAADRAQNRRIELKLTER